MSDWADPCEVCHRAGGLHHYLGHIITAEQRAAKKPDGWAEENRAFCDLLHGREVEPPA